MTKILKPEIKLNKFGLLPRVKLSNHISNDWSKPSFSLKNWGDLKANSFKLKHYKFTLLIITDELGSYKRLFGV